MQQATFVLPNPLKSIDLTNRLTKDTIEKLNNAVDENKSNELLEKRSDLKINKSNPTTAINSSNEKLPFHVVGAAFQSKINAQKQVKEFIKRGFTLANVLPKNRSGLYPVVYGSFRTRAQADSLIQKLKREENAEVWLHF
jgi:hypothetical protein